MSTSARDAVEKPTPSPYLQCPVDDMESFYWVALWVSLRNKTVGTPTEEEQKWRKGLRGTTLERTGVSHEVGAPIAPADVQKFNPILRSLWPLLATWRDNLAALRAEWKNHLLSVGNGPQDTSILHFDIFAYKGALTFLRELEAHNDAIRQNILSQDMGVPSKQ